MAIDFSGIAGAGAAGAAGGSVLGPIGTGVGALLGAGGALIGQLLASGDRDKVRQLLEQSRDAYGQIDLPKLKELAAQQLGPSALAGIQEDPQYRQNINAADASLEDMVNRGGLTLQDQAAQNAVQNKLARGEAAGRNAVSEQMAARGTLGSGAELAMNLANQQNSAQRASEEAANTTATAQQRAYQAILSRAQLAGQNSDRDYSRKAAAAHAADLIAQHNAEARDSASRYNNSLQQGNFSNAMARANAKTGATGALANYYGQSGDRTASNWAAGGDYLGQGVRAATMPRPSQGRQTASEPDEWDQWPGSRPPLPGDY